jgi:hypothetical protein
MGAKAERFDYPDGVVDFALRRIGVHHDEHSGKIVTYLDEWLAVNFNAPLRSNAAPRCGGGRRVIMKEAK